MKLPKKIIIVFLISWLLTSALCILYSKITLFDLEKSIKDVILTYSIGIIIVSSFLIHIIVLKITEKIIVKKIRDLNKEISMINTNKNLKARIQETTRNDEFDILAKDINNMFQSLEDYNKLLVSNEKKYSRLVEGLDDGYAYFKILRDQYGTVKDAFVVEANPSLLNMLGTNKEDLMAGSFSKIFNTHIKDKDIVPKVLKCVGQKNQYAIRNSVRLGVDKWAYLTVYPIESEYFAMIITDISENKKFAEEMKHIANYDVLTRISNRYRLYNKMEELRINKESFAIYYIDLDKFKTINDTLGHDVGDEVLCRAADTIRNIGDENFSVGRLGGDEFLAIMKGKHSIEEIKKIGEEITNGLNAVVSYNNHPYKISASIGASRFNEDTNDIETLLKYADVAMYRSKKNGGNEINVFDKAMIGQIIETKK